MKLQAISDKSTRNNLVNFENFDFYSFLDSWEWLDFKEDF
jgi:hypothetical protein